MSMFVWVFFGLSILSVIGTVVLMFLVYETGVMRKRFPMETTLKSHLTWVNRFLIMTSISVVCVEIMIRARYGFEGVKLFDTRNGQIHAVLDGMYVLFLCAMRFWLTGKKAPTWHRFLFKMTVVTYAGIIATGAVLVLELLGVA